jgi:HAD superfamily hydrolase (TIGR01509 family)
VTCLHAVDRPTIDQLDLKEADRMRTMGLVIFDAFNTLVTSRRGSKRTFLAGLVQTGIRAARAMLADLQAASEGLDHSRWSDSRAALEQWHQAPLVALPGAADCLARLKQAGFSIALCSNWGWDLAADLAGTGLAGYIDVFVTSAEAGYGKPHTRIYQATLELAGFRAEDAVFVGDSLRTDALGPQRAGIRSVLVTRAKEQVDREQVASLGDATRLILRGRLPLQGTGTRLQTCQDRVWQTILVCTGRRPSRTRFHTPPRRVRAGLSNRLQRGPQHENTGSPPRAVDPPE